MQEAIEGYNRAIFHYIKDIVDHCEKSNRGLPIESVNAGFNVITNIYMLTIAQYNDIARAADITGSAIPMFIDFIVQMSHIDSSVNISNKIGLKDAAMFVYKKVLSKERFNTYSLSDTNNLDIGAECLLKLGTRSISPSMQMQVLSVSDSHIVVKNMQLYTSIIRNVIQSLFVKSHFYDERTETVDYYSQLITSMIHLIITIEKKCSKLTLPVMNSIIHQQLTYEVPEHVDTNTAAVYMSWVEKIVHES